MQRFGCPRTGPDSGWALSTLRRKPRLPTTRRRISSEESLPGSISHTFGIKDLLLGVGILLITTDLFIPLWMRSFKQFVKAYLIPRNRGILPSLAPAPARTSHRWCRTAMNLLGLRRLRRTSFQISLKRHGMTLRSFLCWT